jgi:hypothetical protein
MTSTLRDAIRQQGFSADPKLFPGSAAPRTSGCRDRVGDDSGVVAHSEKERRLPVAEEVDADEVEARCNGARAFVVDWIRPSAPAAAVVRPRLARVLTPSCSGRGTLASFLRLASGGLCGFLFGRFGGVGFAGAPSHRSSSAIAPHAASLRDTGGARAGGTARRPVRARVRGRQALGRALKKLR